MSERLKPSEIINTCDVGPEAGEHIYNFLYSIHDQIEWMHAHHVHHPWLPDDDTYMVRLSNATEELASECGKVGPIERCIEYTLCISFETLEKLGEDHDKLRQEIGVFIENGIAVLDELNPEKAHHIQTIVPMDTRLSSEEIPRS